MEASKNSLERIRTAAEHQADCLKAAKEGEMTAEEKQNQAAVEELVQKFETAMDDDSTPQMRFQPFLRLYA